MTTQLYALVPIPAPKDVPDNAVMWGTLEECLTGLRGTPSNHELLDIQAAIPAMVEQLEQFQKDKATFCGTVHQFVDFQNARLDHFEKQYAISSKRAEAEQKRRDRQRVQSYIDGLPDPDEPEPRPAASEADRPDNGELTIKHKPEPAEHGYTFDPDDPDTWAASEAERFPQDDDTPLGLAAVSATRPTNDPAELAYPPSRTSKQVPQPIAISLNEE
jgi:hypothetical protein